MSDSTKKLWYYHASGMSKYAGPETESYVLSLYPEKTKLRVWKKGLKSWLPIKDSELAPLLEKKPTIPPSMPPMKPTPPSPPVISPKPIRREPSPISSVPKAPTIPSTPKLPNPPTAPIIPTNISPPKSSPKPAGGDSDLLSAIEAGGFKLRKVKTKMPLRIEELDKLKRKEEDEPGMLGELARAQNRLKKRQQGAAPTSSENKSSPNTSMAFRPNTETSLNSSFNSKPNSGIEVRPNFKTRNEHISQKENISKFRTSPSKGIPKRPTNTFHNKSEQKIHTGMNSINLHGNINDSRKNLVSKIEKLSIDSWKYKAIEAILNSKE